MYDVCIIGAGAAGCCAAIAAAGRGRSVCLIEKNKKMGRKLYATGNGRCNLTNAFFDYGQCYHSERADYAAFLRRAFGERPDLEMKELCLELGIVLTEKNGYFYPMSYQASSVVWAMKDKLLSLGVTLLEDARVTGVVAHSEEICGEADSHGDLNAVDKDVPVNIERNGYTVTYTKNGREKEERMQARNVVLACGGASYESLGGSMSGYELATSLGLRITGLRPSLCALKTAENVESLFGVRVNATATLECDGTSYVQEGELQFTREGLSGILIFNLSSRAGYLLSEGKPCAIALDFLKGISREAFFLTAEKNRHRSVLGFLNLFLPDKLSAYLLSDCEIPEKQSLESCMREDLERLYEKTKNLCFTVTELADFSSAQVTAGGVCLSEIDENFAVKKQKGLYVPGELLDIDGLCGGYNLTFAMLSGKKAGENL